MSLFETFQRLSSIVRRRRFEEELDEDVRMHLDMATEENLRRGMDADEARRAARRSFGGIEQMKEASRDTTGAGFVESILQDVRFGARLLIKERGFTAAAIGILALGLGLNTAMFSVVNAVLVQPLPYNEPDRIVRAFETIPEIDARTPLSPLNFLDWSERNRVFQSMATYNRERLALTASEGLEQLIGMRASADFFPLLGVTAFRGRLFAPDEDGPESGNVAVLTYDTWLRRFAADPDAVGSTMTLGNELVDVIGVLPADFYFAGATDVEVWRPMRLADDIRRTSRTERFLQTIARLRDGVSIDEAQAEMSAVAADLADEFPDGTDPNGAAVIPLHATLVDDDLRSSVFVLWAAVGLVLLVACFNFANLLMTRSIARRREFSVRAALGAGRLRILRQHFTETTLLAMAGVGAGLLLAHWSIAIVTSLLRNASFPFAASRLEAIGIDGTVVGFGILISLAASVGGLVPALTHAPANLTAGLSSSGRTLTTGRTQLRTRDALVIAEISLTLVLLVGAGLLLNSFWHVLSVDMGFEPERMLTMQLQATPQEAGQYYPGVVRTVSEVPGVVAAGVVNQLPLMGPDFAANVEFENPQVDSPGPARSVDHRIVDGNYFQAMGTALLEGRYFSELDAAETARVAILNETLARRYWPSDSPVGQRIRQDSNRAPVTIVGVVEDMKVFGPESEPRPEIYFPHSQFALLPDSPIRLPNMFLVVRTEGEPTALTAPIRNRMRELDRNKLVTNIRTMDQVLSGSVAPRRLSLALLSGLSVVGLVLAVAGIYSVVAYSVAQRTHEVGIRLALGARSSHVFGLVMHHGLRLATLGLAIGLMGVLGVARWMSGMLFGVSPTDPQTILSIAAMFISVVLVACYVPARRSTRIDPMIALRHE